MVMPSLYGSIWLMTGIKCIQLMATECLPCAGPTLSLGPYGDSVLGELAASPPPHPGPPSLSLSTQPVPRAQH